MPLFKVWWPDRSQTRDDARIFNSYDAEGAASLWADWYDHHSNDYSIVGGEAAEVMVLEESCIEPVAVTVFGEMARSYRARLSAMKGVDHG